MGWYLVKGYQQIFQQCLRDYDAMWILRDLANRTLEAHHHRSPKPAVLARSVSPNLGRYCKVAVTRHTAAARPTNHSNWTINSLIPADYGVPFSLARVNCENLNGMEVLTL